jgi:hypothetical protein
MAHPATIPKIEANTAARVTPATATDRTTHPPCPDTMWLILLEALAALLILVGIVWWTMFSGRRGGERRVSEASEGRSAEAAAASTAVEAGPVAAPAGVEVSARSACGDGAAQCSEAAVASTNSGIGVSNQRASSVMQK